MASAGNPKDDTGLERKMESRHLTMISLGGVIGTGLFVSSGYTIHQAGPLGAILAYAVGSLLVYCVMVSLGELSVAMPYAGSFHMYAKRFIGPGTAFTIAILYWLNWAVALASEFTAAGLLMQRWFPHSPSWVWSAVFIVVVFAHGMVAGQGAADSRAIRQDEFPWCAGVGRAVQHGGFAAGAAVFRARRLDRVSGASRRIRLGDAGGVVLRVRVPHPVPARMGVGWTQRRRARLSRARFSCTAVAGHRDVHRRAGARGAR